MQRNTCVSKVGKIHQISDLTNNSFRSLDHLSGVRLRKNLRYNAEVGLKEAFQSITGKVDAPVKDGVQKMATRIAQAMMKVEFLLPNPSRIINKSFCCLFDT